jgi:hypothetical protein
MVMTDLTALVECLGGPETVPPGGPPLPAAPEHPARRNGSGIGWGAAVYSLDAQALRLLLCYPFKRGTWLAVHLQGKQAQRTVLACVQEAAELPQGSWLVGCSLPQALNAEELQNLLRNGTSAGVSHNIQ